MIIESALATLVPALAALAPTATHQLPYADLAQAFLDSKGKATAPLSETYPEALLKESFVHVSAGIFELWAPADELVDLKAAENYRDLCAALCGAQSEWLKWLGDSANRGGELRTEFATYQSWIESWDPAQVAAAQECGTLEMLALFPPAEVVRSAGKDIAETLRNKRVLAAQTDTHALPIQMVLMPTRRGFVQFIAYGGHQYPGARSSFWIPDIQDWSLFNLNDLVVVALEYASPDAAPGDYLAAYDMNTKSQTGMLEQVVQIGLNQLLANQHGAALPTSLASGLAINLVTQIYATCHSRIDGDVRGRVTSARSQFVRGGLAEGGILPPNSAESRWREYFGKNHFGPILKRVQRAGGKEAKRQKFKGNKHGSFLLEDPSGTSTYLMHAPLLGSAADQPEVLPNAIYGDFLEFNRAYRCAFLHWLQWHGEKSKSKAAAAFARFLSQLSGDEAGSGLAKVAQEVYGVPLSDSTASSKSLEGRFLIWISKYKGKN